MNARNRIIIALDVSDALQALAIVARLRGRVGMFKVGLELFCAAGPDVVRRIVEAGESVFLDLKLHDIPNTVSRAASTVAGLGASMLNIHLSGGARMAAETAAVLRRSVPPGSRPPILLGVTVLTSFDERELGTIGVPGPLRDQVLRLARLGRDAGLDGVVASPHEVQAVKSACGRGFLVVTPGVRPAGSPSGDQRRVMTPAEALAAGADYLVIGRPVTGAPDPAEAVETIVREMGG